MPAIDPAPGFRGPVELCCKHNRAKIGMASPLQYSMTTMSPT
ncbi:hypothetical protein [Burkholderia stagnalis]|nr:hypothetical protein [Burkholderia stagnalis]